jgi:O-methyltransferase involved in polyketide biosynthesis
MQAAPADDGEGDQLVALRARFPQFRLWSEITGDRVRYVARRLHPDAAPHTIVTADLDELCAVLDDAPAQPLTAADLALDAAVPNVARMYDRWLGGKDHYEADGHAADALTAEFPEIGLLARANRAFVLRAVAHVAARGIAHFIDVGVGFPSSPNVYEMAVRADPAVRVAYVDHDPVVLAHARALLADGPGVAVVAGDLREPGAILADPDLRALIDLDQPVCVILAAVLHFLPAVQADAAVAAFRNVMVPGSYLVVSAGTSTGTSPALIGRLTAAYAGTTVVSARAGEEIAGYFAGLDLVAPGLVDVWAWRPDSEWFWPPPPTARILGGVARMPATIPAGIQSRAGGEHATSPGPSPLPKRVLWRGQGWSA